MVANDIFMLSPEKSDELVSSLDGDNPEDKDDSASGKLVETLVGQYRSALEKEQTVFYIMLGLYGLVVLFGLIALLWHEKIRPRLARPKRHPELREFKLEKSSMEGHEPSASQDLRNKMCGLVASPLARLREKKGKQARESNSGSNSVPVAQHRVVAHLGQQRSLFTPPPPYPPSRTADWRQQPSTISLLGALNLPDAAPSRQSLASVQPSSAGVSPTAFDEAASHYPPHGASNPSLPAHYLYGTRHAPHHDNVRPGRPASSANPFKTPFDGPPGS